MSMMSRRFSRFVHGVGSELCEMRGVKPWARRHDSQVHHAVGQPCYGHLCRNHLKHDSIQQTMQNPAAS